MGTARAGGHRRRVTGLDVLSRRCQSPEPCAGGIGVARGGSGGARGRCGGCWQPRCNAGWRAPERGRQPAGDDRDKQLPLASPRRGEAKGSAAHAASPSPGAALGSGEHAGEGRAGQGGGCWSLSLSPLSPSTEQCRGCCPRRGGCRGEEGAEPALLLLLPCIPWLHPSPFPLLLSPNPPRSLPRCASISFQVTPGNRTSTSTDHRRTTQQPQGGTGPCRVPAPGLRHPQLGSGEPSAPQQVKEGDPEGRTGGDRPSSWARR